MNIMKAYAEVALILDKLNYNALFDGFRRYRFALYAGSEIVIDGRSMPYSSEFMGNTSIMFEGEYIAIWNMESDPVEDVERLAYCLVHEMFHCHQRANDEKRYPSDLDLLMYPDDIENYNAKYNENRYLADAYENRDIECLKKFASIRAGRFARYPFMVHQEMKAETLEGMAEYIGLKALKQIAPEKYEAAVEDYLIKLRADSGLLFDIRRISYFAGTIYFLCLDEFGFAVRNAFDPDKTAYEQNNINTDGVTAEISKYDFIGKQYAEIMDSRTAELQEHMARSEYTECYAVIYGYDPMNIFRVGDIIYCRHFVFLETKDGMKPIYSAAALKLAEGSVKEVVGYYV